MRTTDRLRLHSARSALELLLVDPDPTPAGREATDRLRAIDLEVRGLLGERLQADQTETLAAADRDRSATTLRARLARIRDFAAAGALRLGSPGLRLPGRLKESSARALAESAHAMLDAAADRAAVLHSLGMPPTLLEEARRDLAELEDAIERRAGAIAASVTAGQAIRTLALEAYCILRHLDVLVRTRFAEDPARVAQWEAARTVQWPKRRGGGGGTGDGRCRPGAESGVLALPHLGAADLRSGAEGEWGRIPLG
jgi:hypothetical protein